MKSMLAFAPFLLVLCAAHPQDGFSAEKVAAPTNKEKKTVAFTLTSPAFKNGEPIPKTFTGEGKDQSPELVWSGAPSETKEFVLVVDDPDAPSPQPWVHWVLYHLSPDLHGVPANVPKAAQIDRPVNALQGKGSSGKTGYHGPMPPPGHGWHRYFFSLYALSRPTSLKPGATKEEVLRAIRDHVLAKTELVGKYKR